MDNISFSKKMSGWSHNPLEEEIIAEQIDLNESIPNDKNVRLEVVYALNNTISLIVELENIYSKKAHKELYDARIHLAMVKHLLNSIK